MPVGRWGRLEVEGHRVLVFDGINTQTVNVYAGLDDDSEKELIIRLRRPQFTNEEELASKAFTTIDEMQAYLLEKHAGEPLEPPERHYRRFSETLAEIAAGLRSEQASPTPTVKELLAMVGAQRRGLGIVAVIRERLAQNSLVTAPDFQSANADAHIRFILADEEPDSTTVEPEDRSAALEMYVDPTYRISKLTSANRPPERVSPDESLRTAITMMVMKGLSHMPVMVMQREVKGVLSLSSILSRWESIKPNSAVREFMDRPAEIIDSTASIFSVLTRLRDHEYILVRGPDKAIVGSITAEDMVPQFRELTEPFLLLSEIEHHVRGLIASCFKPQELQEICYPEHERELASVHDMNVGDYVRLLEKPAHWERLDLGVDGRIVMEHMRAVNDIRNRVMHFDPDGIDPDDLDELRTFVRFLQRLTGPMTA